MPRPGEYAFKLIKKKKKEKKPLGSIFIQTTTLYVFRDSDSVSSC